jgi:hypothetical protein
MRWRREPGRVALDEAFVDGCRLPPTAWRFLGPDGREEIERGLRDWLLLGGWSMQDGEVVGQPSWLVDEAWHGFILDTSRYEEFCALAYGVRFLHHYPPGALPAGDARLTDAELVARARALWDRRAGGREATIFGLDARLGAARVWS